jgi:hypothetical protein
MPPRGYFSLFEGTYPASFSTFWQQELKRIVIGQFNEQNNFKYKLFPNIF